LDARVSTQETEQEIERAFAAYQAQVADIAGSGEWTRFADMLPGQAEQLEVRILEI
jgi:hypothetical protein